MNNNIIYGKIPVKNAITGKRKPITVFLNINKPNKEILELAKKENIKVKLLSNSELDKLSEYRNHQNAIASLPEFVYTPLDELLSHVKDKTNSTLILLDGIEDPVNFGSIIRSSCAFDVDGIIIGKNRQVQVTSTVSKIATGGEEITPIVQVTNLNTTIEKLKKENYWVVASAGEGKDIYDQINYNGKIVLIIGNEGKGISNLVKENSDFVAQIPLLGKVKALNAAIATAVFLAQIDSYRRYH